MANLQVQTRMYRVKELGDCFLLRFKQGGKTSSVLIDCGSFRNGEKSAKRMNDIANNIADELKEPLSVVVGTHQHNDHLSGFTHAADVWKKLGAKQCWLSWLDNPNDPKASEISREHKKLAAGLEEIQKKLSASENSDFSTNASTERVSDILGFYLGVDGKDPVIPALGLETLKAMSDKTKFLRPGQVLDLPGLDAGHVKVYVLGPPQAKEQLFDIHAGKSESYDHKLAMANTMATNYLKALSNFQPGRAADPEEDFFPFDRRYRVKISEDEFNESIYNQSETWRKIDTDWLNQAERLGLYLDSYTNNTSLVLAFELVQSGKFLLFVGDAQTGNWLSWNDVKWEGKDPAFNADHILANTVLYKVGHHCSHNATLVAGLEAMKHDELVAMIPVDATDAHIRKKNGWKMPASKLHQRLKEKTQYRLIRMDIVYDPDCNPHMDENVRQSWSKLNLPAEHELYIEYTINA